MHHHTWTDVDVGCVLLYSCFPLCSRGLVAVLNLLMGQQVSLWQFYKTSCQRVADSQDHLQATCTMCILCRYRSERFGVCILCFYYSYLYPCTHKAKQSTGGVFALWVTKLSKKRTNVKTGWKYKRRLKFQAADIALVLHLLGGGLSLLPLFYRGGRHTQKTFGVKDACVSYHIVASYKI